MVVYGGGWFVCVHTLSILWLHCLVVCTVIATADTLLPPAKGAYPQKKPHCHMHVAMNAAMHAKLEKPQYY